MPRPPAAAALVPYTSRGTDEFVSRRQIEDNIVRALQDKKGLRIGICGMGAVGKTTMAKKIKERVRDDNLFGEAIMVVIGQPINIFKIQSEMGELLGLKDLKSLESVQARAEVLRDRLAKKHILIVLDDLWQNLELKDLGILDGFEGCGILMTSRNRDVLDQMDVMVFSVGILPKEEAWSLFKDKSGVSEDDPDLMMLAEQVAKECNGLPVAIVTVGKALKAKGKPIWKDVLLQLKRPTPKNVSNALKEVYRPLRVSYDRLEDQCARLLFLLCCLAPEDSDISFEDLTMYMVGLYVFEELKSVEETRNRVFSIVDTLKSRSLLLEGKGEMHVRMHDVIRDVANYIALEERLIDCKWIVVSDDNYSQDWIRSNGVELLLFHASHGEETLPPLSGMECLNVLSFMGQCNCMKLPQEMQWMKNLRTLTFDSCHVQNLSIVGKLLSLEILKCVRGWRIKELPVEIGNLKRLKLLDISDCPRLTRIAQGVISELVDLEELKLISSFKEWSSGKTNAEHRLCASIIELESLAKLRCLQIEIRDCALLAEEIQLSKGIVKYEILVNREMAGSYKIEKPMRHYQKCITIDAKIGILGSWFQNILSNVDWLDLDGQGSYEIDPSYFQHSKRLKIKSCGARKKGVNKELEKLCMFEMSRNAYAFSQLEVMNLRDCNEIETVFLKKENDNPFSFRKLEELQLYDMASLTTICEGIELPMLRVVKIKNCPKLTNMISSPNLTRCKPFFFSGKDNFEKLVRLKIKQSCENIKSLFPFPVAESLIHLQVLSINGCQQLETVIVNEHEWMEGNFPNQKKGNKAHLTLSKLEKLELLALPNLIAFCKGVECIDFPVLKGIIIMLYCPKFSSFCSSESHQNLTDDQSRHMFCLPEVNFGGLETIAVGEYDGISNIRCEKIPSHFFGRLKDLMIYNCGGIRTLFPSSIVNLLENLKTLTIYCCYEMEVVIEDEEIVDENLTLFPRLESLNLCMLPKLRAFYERKSAVQ